MNEDALITRAQSGDRAARAEIVARYTGTAYGIASHFFMADGDRDDVRQEALVGILKGIRSYRPGHVPFHGFVRLAIHRWLITACITEPNREKRTSPGEAPRSIRGADGEVDEGISLIEDYRADVPGLVEYRAELHRIVLALRRLSPLEARCVVSLAVGFSYAEIDAAIGSHFKGTDNAIQRARKKLAA